MNGFEGSFLGNSDRIVDATRLECGVCWWVYDPADGDSAAAVPPGTPFSALPDHWRCPRCDNARNQFMVLADSDSSAAMAPDGSAPAAQQPLLECRRALLRAYTAIDKKMRGLPVYNEKLDIQLVGPREWEDDWLGIVATPWCMNIVLLPRAEATPLLEGTSRERLFPSGRYDFIAGHLPGVGGMESCSLFSPMHEFDSPAVVRLVAEHALSELLDPPGESVPPQMSRRGFLRGGSRGGESAVG